MTDGTHTAGSSRICYLEIPARDVEASARFYERVFGWQLRRHADGSLAFDDPLSNVSGMWETDLEPMTAAGVVVSIMVPDAAATLAEVVAAGGEALSPPGQQGSEQITRFRDPAGNVFCIYQGDPTAPIG